MKRDKKSPMFVSTVPTNYDFVDYTNNEQGELGKPAHSLEQNKNTNSIFDQIVRQSKEQEINLPTDKPIVHIHHTKNISGYDSKQQHKATNKSITINTSGKNIVVSNNYPSNKSITTSNQKITFSSQSFSSSLPYRKVESFAENPPNQLMPKGQNYNSPRIYTQSPSQNIAKNTPDKNYQQFNLNSSPTREDHILRNSNLQAQSSPNKGIDFVQTNKSNLQSNLNKSFSTNTHSYQVPLQAQSPKMQARTPLSPKIQAYQSISSKVENFQYQPLSPSYNSSKYDFKSIGSTDISSKKSFLEPKATKSKDLGYSDPKLLQFLPESIRKNIESMIKRAENHNN